MNRNEALQWLVKSISRWPSAHEVIHGQTPKPSAGNWCVTRTEVILMCSACEVINQSEWLTAVDHAKAIDSNISDEQYDRFTSVEDAQPPIDTIKSPKHYRIIDGIESITIIAAGLTVAEWRGFCLGNILKYRIRAGKKDALEQDIAKANEYESLFERYKGLCRHD